MFNLLLVYTVAQIWALLVGSMHLESEMSKEEAHIFSSWLDLNGVNFLIISVKKNSWLSKYLILKYFFIINVPISTIEMERLETLGWLKKLWTPSLSVLNLFLIAVFLSGRRLIHFSFQEARAHSSSALSWSLRGLHYFIFEKKVQNLLLTW